MRRGKYQKQVKGYLIWAVALVALVLACSFPGVVAFLAKSPAGDAVNIFEAAQPPLPQVVLQDGYSCVDVGDSGYAVYVRAAVIPNWKEQEGVVVMTSNGFSITPGPDWVEHTDGFFYYTKPISSGRTSPIYTAVTAGSKPGGTLEVDVAAQVIQALGTTDGSDPLTAVLDAWGVQPESLRP